jgi:cytochrome c oxidase assembly protein subunit 16
MPTFSSRPHAPSESAKTFQQILRTLRKRPFLLFGAPFLSLMVVSSFALQNLTKTRYDYQSSKTSTMTMEEGLGMNKDRKRVDIREEYFVSRRLGWSSRRGVDGCGLRCGQAAGPG